MDTALTHASRSATAPPRLTPERLAAHDGSQFTPSAPSRRSSAPSEISRDSIRLIPGEELNHPANAKPPGSQAGAKHIIALGGDTMHFIPRAKPAPSASAEPGAGQPTRQSSLPDQGAAALAVAKKYLTKLMDILS